VYLGGAGGLLFSPSYSLVGPPGSDYFGSSVASAGDVNGDGYSDVVVGAPYAGGFTGRAYVYLGGARGLGASPATSLSGPDGRDGQYARSVAGAGDINGDGYADVVVGAYGVGGNTGRVYVYLGGASGLAATPIISLTGPDGLRGEFGYSVAALPSGIRTIQSGTRGGWPTARRLFCGRQNLRGALADAAQCIVTLGARWVDHPPVWSCTDDCVHCDGLRASTDACGRRSLGDSNSSWHYRGGSHCDGAVVL
jgi:hypothetical protein